MPFSRASYDRNVNTAAAITVQAVPLSEYADLAADWCALEAESAANVFLSWRWMGTWLAVYRPKGFVLRMTAGDQLVGLGIVVPSRERRHGVLVSRCLRLHQMGHNRFDQIWIEYNSFLARTGWEADVAEAGVDYLCLQRDDWEEFIIGAIEAPEAQALAAHSQLHAHVRWEAPCYGVDLKSMQAGHHGYLEQLSRNTRYQIRRCHRLYQQRGPVRLVRPTTMAQALGVFREIGPRHLERWGAGKDQSGFANPEFVRFHEQMIRDHWDEGGVDLISVMVGDDIIASLYNLLYRGVVYFYLGGLKVEDDNKLKPGLLGHSLCIDEYRRMGYSYYDFMGGDERYKANLGTRHRHLVQVSLQRPSWKLKLEQAARQAKQNWLARPEPGKESS